MPDDVTTPELPALVTIPGVELCKIGTWSGWLNGKPKKITFTSDDFAAAVAAQFDPAIRSGRIKIGHDQQPEGIQVEQPTIGTVVNLRTTDEGATLVGDLVGVPAWLAAAIPSAFGSRSIEGSFDYTTATGHTHRFVVEGVALLGESFPAVQTLDDIARLYGVAADANPNAASGHRVTILLDAHHGADVPSRVALAVSDTDVVRAYYDQLSGPMEYWWIRELYLEPTELIVDDNDGHLYRVPFTVSGTDVTFGEPSLVVVNYVAASESEVARRRNVTVYASRTESLPEGASMPDLTALRTRLGLADDVSDDDVLARAAEVAAEHEAAQARIAELEAAAAGTGDAPPPPAQLPAGTVAIDEAALNELRVAASQGAEAHATLRRQERDRFIHRHVAAGRLTPANTALRESLEREWDRDPEAAERVAASLAQVMPTSPLGRDGGGDDPSTAALDAEYAAMFPDEKGA